MQPSLAALLFHDAVRSPRCETIVESFVGRTHSLLGGKRHSRIVEAGEITHSVVGGSRHDPGITAAAQGVAESVVVLKEKKRMRAERGIHRVPVDRIRKIDVEVRDHGLSLAGHVRGRGKIRVLNVLQLIDQYLLRRAAWAGIPCDGPLIDHNGKSETRMILGFSHDKLGCLIGGTVRTVPINDYAIDTAADHVCDLAFDLCGIRRAVADIHMT